MELSLIVMLGIGCAVLGVMLYLEHEKVKKVTAAMCDWRDVASKYSLDVARLNDEAKKRYARLQREAAKRAKTAAITQKTKGGDPKDGEEEGKGKEVLG